MSIKDSKPIQVAYVLTSNGKDVYADMNLISLRSLRYTNPNTKIILVCDLDTVQSLENYNHPILQEANQIISVKTPPREHLPDKENQLKYENRIYGL
jgi:predicted glycosyltransferase involved in capsule biosynthesis